MVVSARIIAFNNAAAIRITRAVGTMTCAWLFAVWALLSFPEAWSQAFSDGFHFLPLVTWVSQTFLQLVLLSVVMVGQSLLDTSVREAIMEILATIRTDHQALVEMLQDARDDRAEHKEMLAELHQLVRDA